HGGFWTKGVRTRKVKAYEVEEIESVVEHDDEVQSK
ncbi:DUF2179 domain-containing protein, partial [Staphylococcus capitis]